MIPPTPGHRLYYMDRGDLIGNLPDWMPDAGIRRDMLAGRCAYQVLGLFRNTGTRHPEIVVRIRRPSRTHLIGISVNADRKVVCRGLPAKGIEWEKWCGSSDGRPGALNGDRPSAYARWQAKRQAETPPDTA